MKRPMLLVLVCAGLAAVTAPAQPDPAAVAAAIAQREADEERFRRLNAEVEDLKASNAALQNRLSAMSEEIRRLRETQSRPTPRTEVHEDLRRLSEAIQEVDRKRQEDRKALLEHISRLEKMIVARPSGGGRPTPPAQGASASPGGFEYVVQSGDTLSSVIAAYNAEFRRQNMGAITLKQTLDANPGLVPERMQPGQKIVIPDPVR